MNKIESHPRGLCISLNGNLSTNAAIKRLEEASNTHGVLLSHGRLVFPLESAADILDCVGTKDFAWDEMILRTAKDQREERSKQLSARINIEQALLDPEAALAGYGLFDKLDLHQRQAVAAISIPDLRGLGLFDEQGTGKTVTALAAFDRLNQQGLVRRLLVIAPKSALSAWTGDIEMFLGNKYRTALASGSSRVRRKVLIDPHDILLMNYEGLVSEIGLVEMIIRAQPKSYMLVVDESYFIKNPDAERSRAINRIRPYCERAVVLSGTPAPNSPMDIVNQIATADGGVALKGHAIASTRNDPQDAEEQARTVLGNAIYLRRLKEEVFPSLPAKQFERISIDLQPEQRRMYDEARDELIIAVKSVDDREFARELSSFLARRIFLLQICSHPASLDPFYTEEPAKLLALDRLITEIVEHRGEKAVIWSYFRFSVNAICNRYKGYGLVKIDGSVTSLEDRIAAIDHFQHDPNTMIFVGNAAAAGAGITLTSAHHAIYESFSNQAAHYMQSLDRIHRRGQKENVDYHVLICTNTIEGREFKRILDKQQAQRDLLGDQQKEPITRQRFLHDLGEEG